MANPWLAVPLDDYEGHMGPDGVAQLDALAELFECALRRLRPESAAILGVAGGNGLDRISPDVTTRVCGVDVNPLYLEAVRRRYGSRLPGLELDCVDLAREPVHREPAGLVHAALIFEHAGVDGCLRHAVRLVAACGSLSVVLQLESPGAPAVGATSFRSVQGLSQDFHLVAPAQLVEALAAYSFRLAWETLRPVSGGKAFWMGVFKRLPLA